MTLRPNDYDRYGDIIPMSWKEEKGDLISRSALKEAFLNHSCTEFEIKNMCRANENVIALIDNAPTVEAVPLDFHEKCMDLTVKEMLEKSTESEIVKAYTKGFDTGVETARSKGEYIKEDILQIIKENFDIGYEMAKNKYKRPKGEWIETQRGIHITDYKCSCCGRTVRDDTGYDMASDYPFCHCGADMRGGGDK